MKIALVGYGRMGKAVERVALEAGHEVTARIDLPDAGSAPLTAEGLNGAEVAVEFTAPTAAADNLEALAAAGVDAVCGTTGWYEELDRVRKAVESAATGLIYAPNFSLGVHAFFRLARAAARLAERLEDWDVHLLEAHHRHKADHPSGTARALAQVLLEEITRKRVWELGPGSGPVDPAILQVTAVRAGSIPGTHSVGLEGPDDRIELRHEARDRGGFARGALAAAEWIRGRKGVFTLDDMLADRWS
ncbi:MAG: 4-hydroxy-tetrahydrodipicolinate reductase [Gemmatimonadetes bacterium]|nr:4-hydroxy-tetrahydrodipicolinate reductase [Gemmatimonadota bacterium]NIQ51959.1 4-hydroxy-tetrahydrodipicolinate reductase [Gemmatimonadota bacterium]NIU72062.1 4-hydroxy-tetrahydrodipicolinate reductase [Gammaproteobacteria bacterium]NIX42622.1 4-hydroxy-tetrahydrodipicolinate reductase [Gemmatimonadota bacterium]